MTEKITWLISLLALAVGTAAVVLAIGAKDRISSIQSALAVVEQRAITTEQILDAHLAQAVTERSAENGKETEAETEPVVTPWDAAISELSACGSFSQAVPVSGTLEILGFGGVLSKGYLPKSVCLDGETKKVAFVMAKEVLTQATPEAPETCVGSCDQVVIGILDPTTKVLKYVESGRKFGLYSETQNQECLIDRIYSEATGETLLLYCGPSGNLTYWYKYVLNGDQLILVQELKPGEPTPQLEVSDPETLKKFRRQVP